MNKDPIQPAVDPKTGARRCPVCGRNDAQAGLFWGCRSCEENYDNGYRWWDLIGAGGCHGDNEE
jgi:hypothetical protein